MALTTYKYLYVLLEKLIPKIYEFVYLTCKLKILLEDIQTADTILYIVAKNLP